MPERTARSTVRYYFGARNQVEIVPMIPRWQIAAFITAALIGACIVVYDSPNSYIHAVLWGECGNDPKPVACNLWGRYGLPRK